jgi:hypothetical protein
MKIYDRSDEKVYLGPASPPLEAASPISAPSCSLVIAEMQSLGFNLRLIIDVVILLFKLGPGNMA